MLHKLVYTCPVSFVFCLAGGKAHARAYSGHFGPKLWRKSAPTGRRKKNVSNPVLPWYFSEGCPLLLLVS